jgi:hypothetical protein
MGALGQELERFLMAGWSRRLKAVLDKSVQNQHVNMFLAVMMQRSPGLNANLGSLGWTGNCLSRLFEFPFPADDIPCRFL